jgi:60 kDa SS-A/Ro ribonucleoprotein
MPVFIGVYAHCEGAHVGWHSGCDRSGQKITKEKHMANKTLFQSVRGALIPKTDAVNEAGGVAYALAPKQALAQYAATGCLNSTFYASADDQLQKVLALAKEVDAEFIAKTAVYSREKGFMKDIPAVLCAALSVKDAKLLRAVFDRVIDDGKMLRNFVQVLRSGVVGRKSLGTGPKKLVQRWLESRTDEQLFRASVGNAPSLADLVKMVHPKPSNASREAFYGYLLGRTHNVEALPPIVKQFEAFKAGQREEVPDVAFQMLTALDLGKAEWTAIAKKAPWQMTRMNLNTFARHGVFDDQAMVKMVANRLANADAVKRARVFPYQLLAAFKSAGADVPGLVRDALQDAMEVATQNVPRIAGKVYVCPDVSGSMSSPVTGMRVGATTAVRCIDVAALVAASILRQNPRAEVLPFSTAVVTVDLNGRDSVMTNAQKLAAIGGGGTNCSAPLAWLNQRRASGDLVVFVSDNESWADAKSGRGTGTMREWSAFKQRNPQARLVCIDIQPHATVQAAEREDVLNIGGFSDQVFPVIAAFAEGRLGADHWVGEIASLTL